MCLILDAPSTIASLVWIFFQCHQWIVCVLKVCLSLSVFFLVFGIHVSH